MDTNSLGNLGELHTCLFLVKHGWYPYIGFAGKGPADVLAVKDGVVLRCECKSSSCLNKQSGSYRIKLSSVRYNRNKIENRKFDSKKSDLLFIWIEELQLLFVRDSAVFDGMTETAFNKASVLVDSRYFG